MNLTDKELNALIQLVDTELLIRPPITEVDAEFHDLVRAVRRKAYQVIDRRAGEVPRSRTADALEAPVFERPFNDPVDW